MLKTELEELKTELDNYLASNIGYRLIQKHKYALANCFVDKTKLKELYLYRYVLNYWQQYGEGTPIPDVNFITQEEFNNIANRTKLLIRT